MSDPVVKKPNPEITIAPTEYVCPKHGKIPAGKVIVTKGMGSADGEFCGVCHAENIAATTPRVRPFEKTLL